MVIILFTLFSSCTQSPEAKKSEAEVNPPAKGFNLDNSDKKAIALADEVMLAMGGRQAYDSTRYIAWNFFGARKHVWDKETGEVYINNLRDKYELKMNIHDLSGKMLVEGTQVTDQDTLSKYLTKGKEMWINDAYWLVMPYKLKDSGVTLKYLGESKTEKGDAADKLELTFKDVGVTPENKYHVHVDKKSKLITQWDFYNTYSDTIPEFSTPWEGYKNFDGIQLSGGRGKGALTEIEVGDQLNSFFE